MNRRSRLAVPVVGLFLSVACGSPRDEARPLSTEKGVFASSESLLRTEGTAPLPVQTSPVVRGVQVGGTPMEDNSPSIAFDATGGRIAQFSSWDGSVSTARGYFERRAPDSELLWAKTFAGEAWHSAVNAAGESFLWAFVQDLGGPSVVKLSANGDVVWSLRAPADDIFLAPGGNGDLYALISASRPAVSTTLLHITSNGVVSVVAEQPFGPGCPWSGLVAWNGSDRIAMLCDDRTVRAFNTRAVRQLWTFRVADLGGGVVPDFVFSDLKFTPDGDVLVAWEGNLTAIGSGGPLRWSRKLATGGNLRLAAAPNGNIAAAAGAIHLLDPHGNPIWSAPLPGAVEVASLAFDPAGRVAVAGRFFAEFAGVMPQGRSDVFVVLLE